MKTIVVPLLIAASAGFMSIAWLAHLRIRQQGFFTALALSWAIVLPEYILNVAATRYGYGTYSGAQMASFHLAAGVVGVALVSRYVLGEALSATQMIGFAFLTVGMILVLRHA
jgi:uncharacterized protein (DUF486 family)